MYMVLFFNQRFFLNPILNLKKKVTIPSRKRLAVNATRTVYGRYTPSFLSTKRQNLCYLKVPLYADSSL